MIITRWLASYRHCNNVLSLLADWLQTDYSFLNDLTKSNIFCHCFSNETKTTLVSRKQYLNIFAITLRFTESFYQHSDTRWQINLNLSIQFLSLIIINKNILVNKKNIKILINLMNSAAQKNIQICLLF